jgi:single-stranded DNA-binding protein
MAQNTEMTVNGTVKYVGPELQVSAAFKKRELVVTTEEQYPQHILINFVQDKTEYLDFLKVGEKVSISINLRGREWLDPKTNINRYFNDIQGWKVSKVQPEYNAAAPAAPMANNPQYAAAPADSQFNKLPAASAPIPATFAPQTNVFDDEEDDMPF